MTDGPAPAPSCAHLLPDTDDAGAEMQALYLLRALGEGREFTPELAYFEPGRGHARFADLGIAMHRIERRRRFILDYRARVKRLRDAYASHPPDILHTWLFEGNTVGLAAARAWPATRVVIAQRSGTMERRMPGHLLLMRRLYRRADRALANSGEGAELLADLGVAEGKIVVIPQGIPDERTVVQRSPAELRGDLGIPANTPIIAAVGRADQTKDWPGLFQAMHAVWRWDPRCTLLLVGPTAAEIGELGLEVNERVRAVGWQSQPADFMNAADVVAIPSWTEGNSNVAGEALRLGIPVVSTNTGAHPAAVAAAGGRVVPIRRPDLLGAALTETLESPPDREQIRAFARAHLTVESAISATLDVYRELSAGGSPRASRQASTTTSSS